MNYLDQSQIIALHKAGLETFGGLEGVLKPDVIESVVEQPKMTFAGYELYPTLAKKAAVYGLTLGHDHAFVEGNKRVAFLAVSTFISMNGAELICDADDAYEVFVSIADGTMSREGLEEWIESVIVTTNGSEICGMSQEEQGQTNTE